MANENKKTQQTKPKTKKNARASRKSFRFRPWMIAPIAFVLLLGALIVLINLPKPAGEEPVPTVKVSSVGNREDVWVYSIFSDGTCAVTDYLGEETSITIPSTLGGAAVVAVGHTDDEETEVNRLYRAMVKAGTAVEKGEGDGGIVVGPATGEEEAGRVPVDLATWKYDGTTAPFFEDTELVSIVIPEGVLRVGQEAFSGTKALVSVTLPESLKELHGNAFYRSGIEKIALPESLTTINGFAFGYCRSLTSITIPKSVTALGSGVFYDCRSLASVSMEGVKKIGNLAFYGCKALTGVRIGSGATEIGEKAFQNCTALADLRIDVGDSLKIEKYAFSGCTSLTSVLIPSGTTKLDASAFAGCTGITSVHLDAQDCSLDRSESIKADVLEVFEGAALTSVTFGEGVAWVPPYFLYGCKGITSVTLPSTLTGIGNSSFLGCTGITELTVPENVTEIEPDAFKDCTGLKTLYFNAKNVSATYETSVGGASFNGCTALERVVVGEGVVHLPDNFLLNHENLSNILLPLTLVSVGDGALFGTGWFLSAMAENELLTLGNTLLYYSGSAEHLTLPSTITSIGSYAFANNLTLKSVTFEGAVTAIASYAFRGCASLETLRFPAPEGVTTADATDGIAFPDSLVRLGAGAFSYCDSIKSVRFGKGLEKIPDSAFQMCGGLVNVVIGDTVTVIGEIAFTGCTALEWVTIPDTVTTIEASAFYNGAENVILGSGLTSYTNNCFGGWERDVCIYYTQGITTYNDGLAGTAKLEDGTEILSSNVKVYTYLASAPTRGGAYWHYGENGEVLLWD